MAKAKVKLVPESLPKVARIEIELEDGTVKQWTGKDALGYVTMLDNVVILHQLRTGERLVLLEPTRTFRLPGAGAKTRRGET